jgi:hypothetical protein
VRTPSALAPRSLPASPAHRLAPLPALGHRLAAPLAAAARAIPALAAREATLPSFASPCLGRDELARYRRGS